MDEKNKVLEKEDIKDVAGGTDDELTKKINEAFKNVKREENLAEKVPEGMYEDDGWYINPRR